MMTSNRVGDQPALIGPFRLFDPSLITGRMKRLGAPLLVCGRCRCGLGRAGDLDRAENELASAGPIEAERGDLLVRASRHEALDHLFSPVEQERHRSLTRMTKDVRAFLLGLVRLERGDPE